MKVIWTAVLLAASSIALSQHKEKVSFGFMEFPPIAMDRDNGSRGFLIDGVEAVKDQLGIEPSYEFLPYKRVLAAAQRGEFDVLTLSKSVLDDPKTAASYQCLEEVLLPLTPVIHHWGNIDDKNVELSIVSGLQAFASFLPQNKKISQIPNLATGIRIFANGRTLLVDYKERSEYGIREVIRGSKIEKNWKQHKFTPFRVTTHICWNTRANDPLTRARKLQKALETWQDTPIGKKTFEAYGYTGKFGEKNTSSAH